MGLSQTNKNKRWVLNKKKMGFERMVDQELIEECKQKDRGSVERTKKIWVMNQKKDGVELNKHKQKMDFEQKKDGF